MTRRLLDASLAANSPCFGLFDETVWPSGLRRWLQAPVRKGVGSNPTAVIYTSLCGDINIRVPLI